MLHAEKIWESGDQASNMYVTATWSGTTSWIPFLPGERDKSRVGKLPFIIKQLQQCVLIQYIFCYYSPLAAINTDMSGC